MVFQAGYEAGAQAHQFGYQSIQVLTIRGIPRNSNLGSMAMPHDGADFRFNFKNR